MTIILPQIGDVLDRGRGEVPILLRLQALKQQAAAAGGGVICLVGNHEVGGGDDELPIYLKRAAAFCCDHCLACSSHGEFHSL